jgi:uncharacterized membrane protein
VSTIALALVTFLHDLFTVVWIGGLIALGLTTLPAAMKVLGKGLQTRQLMDTIQRRQRVLVYVSILGLLVTGVLQAGQVPEFQGLFRFGPAFSTVLSLKHILVLAMIAVALTRSLLLGGRNKPAGPAQEKLKAALLYLNISLGIAVLLLSGFGAALSTGPSPV